MANNRLRRVIMTDATGNQQVGLDSCPEGAEEERAARLQQLGASVGRSLRVQVTSVEGEILADLPAPTPEA